MTPFVSVVVPVFNAKDFLGALLDSLRRQDYPKDRYEILVCDDGSCKQERPGPLLPGDKTPPVIRYFFQVRRGPASARNLGIRQARGTIVAFIDADCVASPRWLAELVKGYEGADALLAGIGGSVRIMDEASILSRYYHHVHEQETVSHMAGAPQPAYLITANASYRLSVLQRIRGFDERFDFPGGEDQDISYKIKRLGYRLVFRPEAVVLHRPKKTMFRLLMTYFNYGKGEAYLHAGAGVMSRSFRQGLRALCSGVKIPFAARDYCRKDFGFGRALLFSILDWLRKIGFSAGLFVGSLGSCKRGVRGSFAKSRRQ